MKQYLVTNEQLEHLQSESFGYDMTKRDVEDSNKAKQSCMAIEVPPGAKVLTREQVEAAMYRLGRDQYAQLQQGLDDLFGKEGVNNANRPK